MALQPKTEELLDELDAQLRPYLRNDAPALKHITAFVQVIINYRMAGYFSQKEASGEYKFKLDLERMYKKNE